MSMSITRRGLFRRASLLTAAGYSPIALNLATMLPTVAQAATSGYRALVYMHFSGGNDPHNTVLATDPDSWATYLKYRDTSATDGIASIALDKTKLLPITPSNASGLNAGRTFALHPNLSYLQSLFAARRAAIIANVGPLIAPLTAAQYAAKSVTVPLNLFSHNSQSATWQAFSGPGAQYGWGGKMGDLLLAQNPNAVFSCISVAGNSVFLAGDQVVQLQVGGNGLPAIPGLVKNGATAPAVFDGYSGEAPDNTTAALRSILTRSGRRDLFADDLATVTARSIAAQAQLEAALVPAYSTAKPNGVATPPIGNNLAGQLQLVLRAAASASALGVNRQVFFLNIGGFDSHDNELVGQGANLQAIDDAVRYFDTTATALGLINGITLMTGSDFGRSFTSNGDGTDHGWGSHHFAIGGGVVGGDIYGRFPTLGVNNDDFVGTALLPNQAVEQFGATVARWMGLSATSLADVFPNLKNFSKADLGFMHA